MADDQIPQNPVQSSTPIDQPTNANTNQPDSALPAETTADEGNLGDSTPAATPSAQSASTPNDTAVSDDSTNSTILGNPTQDVQSAPPAPEEPLPPQTESSLQEPVVSVAAATEPAVPDSPVAQDRPFSTNLGDSVSTSPAASPDPNLQPPVDQSSPNTDSTISNALDESFPSPSDSTTSVLPASVPSDLSMPTDQSNPSSSSPTETPVPQTIPPEQTVPDIAISVPSPDNNVAQELSDASNIVPAINQPPAASDSPSLQLEPLESPAIPSTPPAEVPSSAPQTTFGDLLNDNPGPTSPSSDLSNLNPPIDLPVSSPPNSQPASPSQDGPTTNNLQPSISFGDLIKDIKPEESVIQPPQNPPSPPASPDVPPTSADSPLISSNSPLNSSDNPFTSPKPGVSGAGGQPISPLPPIANIDDKLKEALSLRRQKANQVRARKKAKHLFQVENFLKEKGRINNDDIRELLHVSRNTAINYLDILERNGTAKSMCHGKATYYIYLKS